MPDSQTNAAIGVGVGVGVGVPAVWEGQRILSNVDPAKAANVVMGRDTVGSSGSGSNLIGPDYAQQAKAKNEQTLRDLITETEKEKAVESSDMMKETLQQRIDGYKKQLADSQNPPAQPSSKEAWNNRLNDKYGIDPNKSSGNPSGNPDTSAQPASGSSAEAKPASGTPAETATAGTPAETTTAGTTAKASTAPGTAETPTATDSAGPARAATAGTPEAAPAATAATAADPAAATATTGAAAKTTDAAATAAQTAASNGVDAAVTASKAAQAAGKTTAETVELATRAASTAATTALRAAGPVTAAAASAVTQGLNIKDLVDAVRAGDKGKQKEAGIAIAADWATCGLYSLFKAIIPNLTAPATEGALMRHTARTGIPYQKP